MAEWLSNGFDEYDFAEYNVADEQDPNDRTHFSSPRGLPSLDHGNTFPLTRPLDSFDTALLNEPYHNHSQRITNGLGRLTFPPQGTYTSRPQNRYLRPRNGSAQVFDGARFATIPQQQPEYGETPSDELRNPNIRRSSRESSSPLFFPSSPSPRASQPRDRNDTDGVSVADVNTEPIRLVVPQASLADDLPLVEISKLPDSLQTIFPYRAFNVVQSRCFDHVYHTNDNFVMSAPTGSGKTVVLEMAICRSYLARDLDGFKVVYTAPTKALCSERGRDWSKKFRKLNLECIEITGDSGATDRIREIQTASIIITTPEKWDSVTRKWKDNKKLVQSFKLFLIDEVHILGEARGATLEVVVSRMRALCNGIRFVAVSATIQNASDIAEWLGRDSAHMDVPAQIHRFGEEHRPVKLERHVHSVKGTGSAYQLDEICNKHVPAVMYRHARRRPILVFCFTKNSCFATANLLKQKRVSETRARLWWDQPQQTVRVSDPQINELLAEGIAVHHGGISVDDRAIIEAGFLNGHIMVICCTSTLAVGINLPCHLVVIKNTVSFTDEGPREYTDVEIMQMIGRAGRPQFALQGAAAVIITAEKKAERYKRLVTGQEPLESHLHLNLIEHLNAELFLETIRDAQTAQMWLKGTFLYVRLRQNPTRYCISGSSDIEELEKQIIAICDRNVNTLVKNGLVSREEGGLLRCTRFGEAMARYYVRLPTMLTLLAIPYQSSVSDILLAITQAAELSAVRFRQHDKNTYHSLNSAIGIKHPLDEVKKGSQKAFVIVQVELGGIKPPVDGKSHKINHGYLSDRTIVFNNVHRLARCAVDCKIATQDATSVRSGLELIRCLSARVWEDSPLQMKQIPGIGPVTIRKLAEAGVTSIEALEECDPARVNMILGASHKGEKFRQELRSFPKLWIQVSQINYEATETRGVVLSFRIQFGFLNKSIPEYHARKPVYVCIVAQRSDNHLIDFRRMRAKKSDELICLQTELSDPSQYVTCYAVCDDLVGTLKQAELKPKIPNGFFSSPKYQPSNSRSVEPSIGLRIPLELGTVPDDKHRKFRGDLNDGWLELDAIAEGDLLAIEQTAGLEDIETVDLTESSDWSTNHLQGLGDKRRSDGKFECNHRCKDKAVCRHLCCREGLLDIPRKKRTSSSSKKPKDERSTASQVEVAMDLAVTEKKNSQGITGTKQKSNCQKNIQRSSSGAFPDVHDTTSANLWIESGQPAKEPEDTEWSDFDEASFLFDEDDSKSISNTCEADDILNDSALCQDLRKSTVAPSQSLVTKQRPSLSSQHCASSIILASSPPMPRTSSSSLILASSRTDPMFSESADEDTTNEYCPVDPTTAIDRAFASAFGLPRLTMNYHTARAFGQDSRVGSALPSWESTRFNPAAQSLRDGNSGFRVSAAAIPIPQTSEGDVSERPQKRIKRTSSMYTDNSDNVGRNAIFIDDEEPG